MTRKTREEIGELSPEQIEYYNRLAARPDSEIDFSDIPEITKIPANAIRGKDRKYHSGDTVVLSDEVHTHIAAIAARRGISISAAVNDVLAKALELAEVAK
ncbi:MAG: hypothetical protein JO323_10590 [Acidobacteriia bacterium]|nr:hypothetical protein [Terriglobia bacterium]